MENAHILFSQKNTEYLLVLDYVSGSDVSLPKMLHFYKQIGVYKISTPLLASSVGSAV